MKEIGGGAGDCFIHVLQDESLFEPCFFFKQVMCFAGLYHSGMPQKRPREQLGISLVSSEIQKLYRMMSITRDVKHQQQTKYDTI